MDNNQPSNPDNQSDDDDRDGRIGDGQQHDSIVVPDTAEALREI
ncbi:MAG TPA: hypothetical protein VGM14_18255 [Streptosporangiaceae bacterium]